MRNKLYQIKRQQKDLKEQEKDLKSEILRTMSIKSQKDKNGTIEKIERKPKTIYDRNLLEKVLKDIGMSESQIQEIIKSSTRQATTQPHLSVTPKPEA